MSVSEGQPALTPKQIEEHRQWIKDWRDGMFSSTSRDADGWPIEMHGVVLAWEESLAELAREREATERALSNCARAQAERKIMRTAHTDLLAARQRAHELEGRVRELQEALERVAQPPGVAGGGDGTELLVRIKIAREALVGLPERPDRLCECGHPMSGHGPEGCEHEVSDHGALDCPCALVGLPERQA